MKLIFIRHGDPDYKNDTLTEKGWREAEYLSERVKQWSNINEIYVSPLGRAKDTASLSLKKLDKTAIIKEWLKEFYYPVDHPENSLVTVPWDFYPENWTKYEDAFDKDKWSDVELMSNPDIKPKYKEVCVGIDEILKEHGVVRNGRYYNVTGDNNDTIVFFCHLGVICVILSHLLSLSPFILWHNFFLAPTSVTIVGFEERDKGKGSFRVQIMGDTRHLPENNELISEAGYFTDCFQG